MVDSQTASNIRRFYRYPATTRTCRDLNPNSSQPFLQGFVENTASSGLYFSCNPVPQGVRGNLCWGARAAAAPCGNGFDMLVLARQRDETIVIGDDIEVTVVDIRGDKVRLGISAPKTVSVHRKEIYDAIRRENKAAAQLDPNVLPNNMQRQTMRLHKPLSPEEAAAHARCMAVALEEAKKGLAEGGLPIGSVLVRGSEIIGRGHNRRVQKADPMAHAEIDCLTNAGRQDRYKDTVLYSTLAPCYLCSGAVVQFNIKKVVVGESRTFPGGPAFMRSHGVEVIDMDDPECAALMRKFIAEKPQLWNEDIGL